VWFVLLGIALSVVVTGGLYFRWRLLAALEALGTGPRVLRPLRWILLWLLFGYPILVFAFVLVSYALGRDSVSISASGPVLWLIGYPFWISVLTMVQAVPFLFALELFRWLAVRKKGPPATRWWALACVLVVAGFALYTPTRIIVERSTLHVKRFQLGTGEGAPFRFVFLGDLQQDDNMNQTRANEVVSLVNQEKADLIIYGGDWISSGKRFIEAAAGTGGKLRSRLGTMSAVGDHEHFAYRDQQRSVREVGEALQKNQVELINNELRWIDHEGKRIGIIFLNYNYIYRTPAGEVQRLIDKAKDADYSILVTHQFDAALADLARDQVDLVLAGHTHGGQVNPVLGFQHVSLARVETEHVEGRYDLGERTVIIVTAGIGYSIAPFRYASPASYEVIELRL
jgi:predicted MPP superfamily phosphohydrolase